MASTARYAQRAYREPVLAPRASIHPSCSDRVPAIQIILEQVARVAATAVHGATEFNHNAFDREAFQRYFRIDNSQYRELVRLRFHSIHRLSSENRDQVNLRCDDPGHLCIRRPRLNAHTFRDSSTGQTEVVLCRRFFTRLEFVVAIPRITDDQVFVLLRKFIHTREVAVPPLRDFKELGLSRYIPERLWPQQAIESAPMFELYAKTLWFRTWPEQDED